MTLLDDMKSYHWKTTEPHSDNTETMDHFLENYLSGEVKIIVHDGTYAEIETNEGLILGVHASGDGDSYHHKVEFELL